MPLCQLAFSYPLAFDSTTGALIVKGYGESPGGSSMRC